MTRRKTHERGSRSRIRLAALAVVVSAPVAVFAVSGPAMAGTGEAVGSHPTIDGLRSRGDVVGFGAQPLSAVVGRRAYINRYLSALAPLRGGKEQPGHPVGASTSSTQGPLSDATAESGQSNYACTTTPYSLTSNPETIVSINPDANKMWLGGLLQGRGYANGPGSLRELPIRKRAPLSIYVDLIGRKNAVTIKSPTPASVQNGIGQLVQRAIHAHVDVPTRATFDQVTQNSTDQALLDAHISAKYLGASVSAGLDADDNAQQSSVLASFYQRMFTVSIVTPATPADYFTSRFSKADFQEQVRLGRVARTNPPVVVGSISFGRILLYSVTSTASSHNLKVALSAAWSGGVASGNVQMTADQKRIIDNAEYKVVALGGKDSQALNLIRTHKLGDYFSGHSSLATAVPISYQVNNIGDDSAAKFSETTNYNLTECTAVPNHQVVTGATVQVSNPNAYVTGPRNPADVYGFLNFADRAQWNVSRDFTQTLNLHTVTPLAWLPTGAGTPGSGGSQTFDLYFDPSRGPSSLNLSGSMNCKLSWWEIGDDPSNQYNWTWNINNGSYGRTNLDGGSAHCGIQLQTDVTKVRDLTEWRP